ncbi:MAG: ribokinase [Microbacterium sp.]|nr:ribokinase [Microbacterium sp.]
MTAPIEEGTGRIGVVGSLNLDRFLRLQELPAAGESVHAELTGTSPGGKGANQAAAAALLGVDVQLIGAVGSDEAGDVLLAAASDKGVDIRSIVRAGAPTGEATILIDAGGENIIVIVGGANLALRPETVQSIAPSTDIVVAGFEVADDVVEAAARHADAIDALFVLNPSPLRAVTVRMRAKRMLTILNETESAGLLRAEGLDDDAIGPLSELLGGSDLIVTRGARGSIIYESANRTATVIDSRPVSAVDTSGCGDAFTGAAVAALSHGATLREAAEYGRDVGALVATRYGTQSTYPTADELAAWVAEQ